MTTKYRRVMEQHKTARSDFWGGFGWGVFCILIAGFVGLLFADLAAVMGKLL